jgi:hypothetical protein
MSKRVLILFGVGVLLIAGAFFLLKYELTEKEPETDEIIEEEADPEIKPELKQKKPKPDNSNLPINKTLQDETGAENPS